MNKLPQIPSEAKIQTQIRKIMFGKHLFCPHCHSRKIKPCENRYRCIKCRRKFSMTSNTWLRYMKISYQELWKILDCYISKIPIDQTSKFTGLSELTVRRWYEKFRDNLPEEIIRLSGKIQMDEAYRKGYCILGAKDEHGHRALKVLHQKSVNRHDAIEFMEEYVITGSELNTDGSKVYMGIEKYFPVKHKYEYHNKFQFQITSEIEGLWGNLFTFIRRMYHHTTKSKIELVSREFQTRQTHKEWFFSPKYFLKATLPRYRYQANKKKNTCAKIPSKILLGEMLNKQNKTYTKLTTVVPS